MAVRVLKSASTRARTFGLVRWPVPLAAVISGGQTGVDRAAQRAARALGLQAGGWCPRRRRAEDGRIPDEFLHRPCTLGAWRVRTARNVMAGDATLLIVAGSPRGGTLTTLRVARGRRPCFVLRLGQRWRYAAVRYRLARRRVRILNVAGPRASEVADIEAAAATALHAVLAAARRARPPAGRALPARSGLPIGCHAARAPPWPVRQCAVASGAPPR